MATHAWQRWLTQSSMADHDPHTHPERVLISYSHESPAHRERVLALAARLRHEGVFVMLDEYDPHPSEGWPQWMRREIREATHVLVVCTKTYRLRADLEDEPGRGTGTTWEVALLLLQAYAAQGRNDKIIPVVFSAADEAFIPDFLLGVTRYDVGTSDGYEALYARLTGQRLVQVPPLGPRRTVGGATTFEPLSPAAQARLGALICEAFDGPGLDRLATDAFEQRLSEMVQQGSPLAMATGLVALAERHGTTARLLQAVRNARPGCAGELDAILGAQAGTRSWRQLSDPFEARLLHARQPFLDRTELRAALRDLCSPDGARVLLIDGEPQTGKSYTYHFISYLAQKNQFKVIWIDLVADAFAGYGPGHLARSISAQMGVRTPMPDQGEETPARYAMVLRDWLLGELTHSGTDWWLVLDGVRQVDLHPAVQDLIQHLMIRAHSQMRNLRVAALACRDDFLPPHQLPVAHREQTRSIGRPDLETLFQGLLDLRGAPYEADAVEEAVQAVERLLYDAATPAERMQRLPGAVRLVAETLFTVSETANT